MALPDFLTIARVARHIPTSANHTKQENVMFVARKSNNIESDMKRQWSSWNFGADGFTGTREELDAYLATATDENPVCISEFEIYAGQLRNFKFGELYANYWVVIDDRFTGLATNSLQCKTLDKAIAFMEENGSWFCGGDGCTHVDTTEAKLVWSKGDLHILEIED